MVHCEECGVKIEGMPFRCHYCNQFFCGQHRLPEDHFCNNLHKRDVFENLKDTKTTKEESFMPMHKRKQGQTHASKKTFFKETRDSLTHWLNEREHNSYDWKGRVNYLITIASIFIVSIIVYKIIYSNTLKLNSINIWIINLAGILLLVSVFFILKYGWKVAKEIPNIIKRQKNWLRWLIILLILLVLWQAYENRDTLFDPIIQYKENTNFSYFNPLKMSIGGIYNKTTETVNQVELKISNPEQYKTSPKEIKFGSIKYTVYGGVNNYLSSLSDSISYYYVPPTTKDFIVKDLDNQIQDTYLKPLVDEIRNKNNNNKEQAKIAISAVQNIPYDWKGLAGTPEGRMPYEVLYDNTGVCGEKSLLLAYVLRDLGFGVAIFEFEAESHRAVGIKCAKGNYNSNYCFIESTSPYPVGQIPSDYVGGADIRRATPEIVIISGGYSYN